MRTALLAALLVTTPVFADDTPTLKEVSTENLKIAFPKGGKCSVVTEITTADELAESPLFKDCAEALKKEVNFDKEKLIVLAWRGPKGDIIVGSLATNNQKLTAKFLHGSNFNRDARDTRDYVQLYLLSKSAEVRIEEVPWGTGELLEAREISTKDLKIAFPAEPGGPGHPGVVISLEQLTRCEVLKDAAEEIAKQVDFDTERLVVVAWFGSCSDQFTLNATLCEKKLAIGFHVKPGRMLDYSKNIRLFVVPKHVGLDVVGR